MMSHVATVGINQSATLWELFTAAMMCVQLKNLNCNFLLRSYVHK